MTFNIATAEQPLEKATPRQYDGVITFKGFGERAERKHRQIIAAIECCETAQEVDDTLVEQDFVLDALLLDYPDYHEAVSQCADDHKAILAAGHDCGDDTGAPVPIPATAQGNVLNKAF